MGALAPSTSSANWLVEDDILLKNAVETGASLESLAKGAVCFSRKFTLQELQDRWNSLLYDSEISAQVSARMVEYEMELSTSNPAKAHKLFNSKAKDFAFQKRKIDSVKNLYYAMRKRIRTEPCNTAELGFLVAPCSCIAAGGECVCGGILKPSHGQHVAHDIEAGESTMGCYGQVGGSYNRGQPIYPELNRHPFHTKHAENMMKDGNVANSVPYGYSDVEQIYDQHAYTQKNPETNERNNMSLKGITDFQDSMRFQQLSSNNQCGNEVAESISTDQGGVEHGHFAENSNGRMQEPSSLHLIDQPEGPQAPGTTTWNGVEEGDTLTLADDKKIKTVNRDHIMLQTNLDGGICTPGLDHAAMSEGDFIDFPFFSNSEEIELLNGEDFLNSPNQEDVDDPDLNVVLGATSTKQNQLHPAVANICCDLEHPGHVKLDAVDVSGIILVPTSSEVPYPGQYVECKLNTEDPEIPCNDDDIILSDFSVQCLTDASDQNPEHNICSVSTATSPPPNVEHSDVSGLAIVKREHMANAQPSSQPVNLSPSTSGLKESPVELNKGCVLGAKPSEGPSTAAVHVHDNIVTNDENTCTLALPAVCTAGFGEGSPCNLERHNSFDKSQSLTLQNSVELPDHMDFNPHNNQPELRDVSILQNCMPSHGLPDVNVQDHVAMVPTSAQAEECSDDEKDVPNFYDIEALILEHELIPWDQDIDLIHPEVSRFQHPESRKSLIRLEQGARSCKNRDICSRRALAVIYGVHLKYFIKDTEVTLGRETEDVKVDIDLGKEGRANKISRRQAIIKMDEVGSFHIKNIGKYSIFVNSKEVPCCKRINLTSDSLIEIKDMRFIFHIDQDAVRRHIADTLKAEH